MDASDPFSTAFCAAHRNPSPGRHVSRVRTYGSASTAALHPRVGLSHVFEFINWHILYEHVTEAFRQGKEVDTTHLRHALSASSSLGCGELTGVSSELSTDLTEAGDFMSSLKLTFSCAIIFATEAAETATLCVSLQTTPRQRGVAVVGAVFVELERAVDLDMQSSTAFNLRAPKHRCPSTALIR